MAEVGRITEQLIDVLALDGNTIVSGDTPSAYMVDELLHLIILNALSRVIVEKYDLSIASASGITSWVSKFMTNHVNHYLSDEKIKFQSYLHELSPIQVAEIKFRRFYFDAPDRLILLERMCEQLNKITSCADKKTNGGPEKRFSLFCGFTTKTGLENFTVRAGNSRSHVWIEGDATSLVCHNKVTSGDRIVIDLFQEGSRHLGYNDMSVVITAIQESSAGASGISDMLDTFSSTFRRENDTISLRVGIQYQGSRELHCLCRSPDTVQSPTLGYKCTNVYRSNGRVFYWKTEPYSFSRIHQINRALMEKSWIYDEFARWSCPLDDKKTKECCFPCSIIASLGMTRLRPKKKAAGNTSKMSLHGFMKLLFGGATISNFLFIILSHSLLPLFKIRTFFIKDSIDDYSVFSWADAEAPLPLQIVDFREESTFGPVFYVKLLERFYHICCTIRNLFQKVSVSDRNYTKVIRVVHNPSQWCTETQPRQFPSLESLFSFFLLPNNITPGTSASFLKELGHQQYPHLNMGMYKRTLHLVHVIIHTIFVKRKSFACDQNMSPELSQAFNMTCYCDMGAMSTQTNKKGYLPAITVIQKYNLTKRMTSEMVQNVRLHVPNRTPAWETIVSPRPTATNGKRNSQLISRLFITMFSEWLGEKMFGTNLGDVFQTDDRKKQGFPLEYPVVHHCLVQEKVPKVTDSHSSAYLKDEHNGIQVMFEIFKFFSVLQRTLACEALEKLFESCKISFEIYAKVFRRLCAPPVMNHLIKPDTKLSVTGGRTTTTSSAVTKARGGVAPSPNPRIQPKLSPRMKNGIINVPLGFGQSEISELIKREKASAITRITQLLLVLKNFVFSQENGYSKVSPSTAAADLNSLESLMGQWVMLMQTPLLRIKVSSVNSCYLGTGIDYIKVMELLRYFIIIEAEIFR